MRGADRLSAAVGVDFAQWRALTRAYLLMDMRRAGGAHRRGARSGFGAWPFTGLLIVTALTGAVLAALSAALEDAFTAAVILTTYVALNTALLLFLDFTGIVVSPDDYGVLGPRPIDSRTYFAARLASLLVYVLLMTFVLAALPAVAIAWAHGAGLPGFAATVVAALLCSACATVIVIAAYAALLTVVHPRRLSRALSYLQLFSMMLFLGGYGLVLGALEDARVREFSLAGAGWIWLDPAAWFAAFVPIAAGAAGRAEILAGGAALAVTAACVPLAAGRLSLGYAERLAELSAAPEPAARRRSARLPGFSRGEAHAVALLIRAQFRYDNRFRLAILSIVPLTAFYLFLGLDEGALADPFSDAYEGSPGPLYFTLVFLPMTLHTSLHTSESWRAAWVFFATPADPARLIVAAKNFVATFFLGGYLLLLAALWSVFYDRIWHAFLHAAVIGLLAHVLLQAAGLLRPALPFAAEPRKAERSSHFFALFLVGGLISGMIPVLLPLIYRRPSWTIAFVALLVGATAALEFALHLRAREAVLDLEF